jgi:hypothetical protein
LVFLSNLTLDEGAVELEFVQTAAGVAGFHAVEDSVHVLGGVFGDFDAWMVEEKRKM